MTLHNLRVVIEHRYSQQELQVAYFGTTGIMNT